MAKNRSIIQEPPLKSCHQCELAEALPDYIDYLGLPILFRCPYREHAFGRWMICEVCERFKQKIEK